MRIMLYGSDRISARKIVHPLVCNKPFAMLKNQLIYEYAIEIFL